LYRTASARGTIAEPGTNVQAKAGLNRSVLDNAWGERRRQLEYKAPLFGSERRGHQQHADKNAALEIEERARRAGGLNSTRRQVLPSPRATGRRLREPLAGAA